MTEPTVAFTPFARYEGGISHLKLTEESFIHIATTRRLHIEGSHNLRDLGGIESADGGRIKSQLIYRSGSLERLTPTGVRDLLTLRIGTIFDLRSGPERDHSPTHWLAEHDVGRWQLAANESLGDPKPLLAQSLRSATKTRAMMHNVYRTLPVHHRESYAALFHALARDERPILFHCAAGKDRTGVATALLLALLGVHRAQIDADYLLTNTVIKATTQTFLSDPRNVAALSAPAAAWKPMMIADTSYLDAMFAEIDAAHGSVEAYVRTQLDLSVTDIRFLRERLLG